MEPKVVPAGLYDAIYATVGRIDGGYDRYLRYAQEISQHEDSFGWLADQEDMYWGVRQLFQSVAVEQGAKIVEIGCGLGYLTYALRFSGFDAHGIDLSRVAVDAARSRYGSHFSVGDALESERLADARIVIAMELIEHLADPVSFLSSLRRNLPPTAAVIISTPNRDAYPAESVWNTDLPPVHLHWFSEAGVEAMARQSGFTVEFADFTALNAASERSRWIAGDQYRMPRFDESLKPVARRPPHAPQAVSASRVFKAITRRIVRLSRRSPTSQDNRLAGRRSVALVARLVPV